MLSLPRDTFGHILKKRGSARALAYTCKSALELVKSLFTITITGGGEIIITRPHGTCWGAKIFDTNYVAPLYAHAADMENHTSCEYIGVLIKNYRHLGVAVLRGSMLVLVYSLAAAAELSYFGQYLQLLGPIKGILVGGAAPPAQNTIKFRNVILFLE